MIQIIQMGRAVAKRTVSRRKKPIAMIHTLQRGQPSGGTTIVFCANDLDHQNVCKEDRWYKNLLTIQTRQMAQPSAKRRVLYSTPKVFFANDLDHHHHFQRVVQYVRLDEDVMMIEMIKKHDDDVYEEAK